MVKEAILLPNETAEKVAHEYGELSTEAVRETYTKEEIAGLQRRARDECDEIMVLAVLEDSEVKRVEEAAVEADEHPAVWLAEATMKVMTESRPTVCPEALAEKVERAILIEAPA